MKHKVSELEGARLRRAVAMAVGYRVDRDTCESDKAWRGSWVVWIPRGHPGYPVGSFSEHGWCPDLNWEYGGPIIDRENLMFTPAATVDTSPPIVTCWRAIILDHPTSAMMGPTRLIAAMRAFVASKFGDEVDLP